MAKISTCIDDLIASYHAAVWEEAEKGGTYDLAGEDIAKQIQAKVNDLEQREQALAVWVERVCKWWGEESKTKLNLKEIEMIINEKPVQDSKQKSNCSDERPCIPCFIGKGECHDLTKRDLIKQAEGASAVRHLTQGNDWDDDELRIVIDDYITTLHQRASDL